LQARVREEEKTDPIVQQAADFYSTDYPARKKFSHINMTTMNVKPSRDEIINNRNPGQFNDRARVGDRNWKPSCKYTIIFIQTC